MLPCQQAEFAPCPEPVRCVHNLFEGGPNMPAGTTPGMWHAIYARPGQYLSCHVILASGAHWSGLPLHALSTTESFDPDFDDSSQPWGAMGNDIEAVRFDALEGLIVNVAAPVLVCAVIN